ncbi:beta-N-acetylhexosaminidase [Paenibacillus sp. HWE-109]|uniref:beta-N-acetylhexosaminidase n=1 Tax=Paenibacillus sp. HWE-109 TaxID=1306526 RepID=UPI001EDF3BE4|nr:beta-N-acetylhexosaminidase [Paenibacillus sp. HWE-109]UKS25699.1 beta-N-acetylhexosaminidase [Paenibacillus sp. HWE-109]
MTIQVGMMDENPQINAESMTLEQKIGLMCVVGIPSYQVEKSFYEAIEQRHYGGIGLFPHNITNKEQVAQINRDLQVYISQFEKAVPYLISIDEEGGTLSNFIDFFPTVPGNRAIGLANDPQLAYLSGRLIGSQLHSLGVMIDWAPVLDVNTNPLNPVIGVRSYGEDPAIVAEYGTAFMKGMRESGVLTTAKHFPGHGDVHADSHVELPSCELTLEQLYQEALIPFQHAIASGIDAIMTAHLVFPNIPASNQLPASLSPYFINQLLRQDLGYDGVICTDDIEMHAIKNNYIPEEIGVMAVQAGNDQILMCHTPEFQNKVYDGILQAVQTGVISEDRINQSIRRILKLQQSMKRCRAEASPIPSSEWEELALRIAESSIVIDRDPAQLLPLKEQKYLLILPESQKLTQADTTYTKELSLAKWLSESQVRYDIVYTSMEPSPEERLEIERQLAEVDAVIQVTRNAHMFRNQVAVAEMCAQRKPHICLIIRNPYDAEYLPKESTVVQICSATDESMKVLCKRFLRGGC